ncbi:DNA-binding response regulator, partial [Streptococcus suis]|nr:DNA-binding response regulator [Streptococcus suis]
MSGDRLFQLNNLKRKIVDELFFYHLSSPSRYLTKNILSSIVKIRKLFYFGLHFSVKS